MIILYVDVRDDRSVFERYEVEWQQGMTIEDAISKAISKSNAERIITDLKNHSDEIIVSWVDARTLDHSEIGGVGRLKMPTTPNFVVSIVYENQATTEAQIDASTDWMLKNDH